MIHQALSPSLVGRDLGQCHQVKEICKKKPRRVGCSEKCSQKEMKKSRDFVLVSSNSDPRGNVPTGQNTIADGFNHSIRCVMP